MKRVNKRKKLFSLFLAATMVTGCLPWSEGRVVVKADEITVDNELVSTEDKNSKEIRSAIDANVLTDVDWVEAVVEKDGQVVTASQWFSTEELQWKISTLGWLAGNYIVHIYKVSSNQEMHFVDDIAIADVHLNIEGEEEFQYSGFVAKDTINENSGKPSITAMLSGVYAESGVENVRFSFSNAKGKVVYTKKASLDENGNYYVEATAGKLNSKAGTYTVSAIVTDLNGVEHEIDKTVKAKLHVAVAAVKGQGGDKSTGTFIFKTSELKAIAKVKSVKMKVWCKSSDQKTYSNLKKDSDGCYAATVDVSKHLYHFGTYYVDVVVTLEDGSKETIASNSFDFAPKNFVRFEKTTQKNKKAIWIYNPTETSNMYADVWSKESGGKDKVTYEVTEKTNALKVVLNLKKLSNTGTVYVQFKQKKGNSYSNFKKYSFTATANDISKHGWFYEKASNGSTYKFYYSKGKKVTNLTDSLNINKQKMYIEVNRKMNTVTVYAQDKETGKWNVPVIAFTCSVGLPGTPTPTGTYKTDRNHRWKELMGPSYGQYCTHIVGGIYFHSVAGRNTTPYNISAYAYNKLGSAASHGCIRLCVRDAKWIYDHCAIGTTVKIYDGNYNGPFGKPATIKIPASQNWDPTDPAVKK